MCFVIYMIQMIFLQYRLCQTVDQLLHLSHYVAHYEILHHVRISLVTMEGVDVYTWVEDKHIELWHL